MTYLLDVNALLASIITDHPMHPVADDRIRGKSLAVCPLSELGFIRVSTQPKAFGLSMKDARRLLESFVRENGVVFLPADLAALKSNPLRSDEVTDHYLADLAAAKDCKLATLDTRLNHRVSEIIA